MEQFVILFYLKSLHTLTMISAIRVKLYNSRNNASKLKFGDQSIKHGIIVREINYKLPKIHILHEYFW